MPIENFLTQKTLNKDNYNYDIRMTITEYTFFRLETCFVKKFFYNLNKEL